MRAAVYCRVSTEEQSTANQLQVITAWAKARGYKVVKVYEETESGWKDGHQHELSQLMRDAKRGLFDAVLVWALDRLSREGPLKILQLVQELQIYRIRLISYQEPWTQAEGPMTELLYSITAWVARYESERRSERTKAGMLRKARECGGRIPPRGPDKKKRKRRRPREPLWEGD